MINWEQYTLLAQILGGLLGIAYAYVLHIWFERIEHKKQRQEQEKQRQEVEEYAKKLKQQYK